MRCSTPRPSAVSDPHSDCFPAGGGSLRPGGWGRAHAVCAGFFHIFAHPPCMNGIMPVFNASVKKSGSIRMPRTGNQNGTALKVGANLGAAGRAVRPSLRVSVVLVDGASIVSSAPCGQRPRIRHKLGGNLC